MKETKYLIVGSSHAGLSALDAIRVWDGKGPVMVLTQEKGLPYSPTVLPYVVSGETAPDRVFLRDAEDLARLGAVIEYGVRVAGLDTAGHSVSLESGETVKYEKLLLATGASPARPPIEGLEGVPCHVLRTLDDASLLREACKGGRSAVVLGAGLIGMHAAENLAKGGMQTAVVEALEQVLPGYFDVEAAGLIEKAFVDQGVNILTGTKATRVARSNGGCSLELQSGREVVGDVLMAATGVRPNIAFLEGSGVEVDQGILVDDRMRSSAPDVWAAGDVAQAPGFFEPEKGMNPTLPSAVEQGRIAGMDMADDPALKTYGGRIPMNTYGFFGHQAFAVGLSSHDEAADGVEIHKVALPGKTQYQKLVLQEDRLIGASGINSDLDPGILLQLIRRRIDLQDVKQAFADDPLGAGRVLMTKMWR